MTYTNYTNITIKKTGKNKTKAGYYVTVKFGNGIGKKTYGPFFETEREKELMLDFINMLEACKLVPNTYDYSVEVTKHKTWAISTNWVRFSGGNLYYQVCNRIPDDLDWEIINRIGYDTVRRKDYVAAEIKKVSVQYYDGVVNKYFDVELS